MSAEVFVALMLTEAGNKSIGCGNVPFYRLPSPALKTIKVKVGLMGERVFKRARFPLEGLLWHAASLDVSHSLIMKHRSPLYLPRYSIFVPQEIAIGCWGAGGVGGGWRRRRDTAFVAVAHRLRSQMQSLEEGRADMADARGLTP